VHDAVEQGNVRARRMAHVQVGIAGMSMRRGSATISFAPRRRFAWRTLMPMTGCCSVVLLPMMKMQRLSLVMSRIEFVMAPLPKLVTRPVTVAAVSKTGAMVYVVGAEYLSCQLVHQVVLFVGALG